ncbi:MAG TPA: hypothetical protein PK447_08210 [Ignavibacteria bacterium]|nr:hypothetical protein [Ignavibacteria bacterium]
MKAKLLFFTLLLLLISQMNLHSQSLNVRVGTYMYSWQRMDSLDMGAGTVKTTHLRGYQDYMLDISSRKWEFSTNAQTEEDITEKSGRGFGYRIYNAFIKGSNLFNVLDVKLGRQYVSQGVGRGTIDGINFKLKLGKEKQYQLSGFGGALTPLLYDFDNYPKLKDSYGFGAMFSYYGVKNLMLGVSYYNKNNKPDAYYTTRLDSILNTQTVFIEPDSKANQMAGFDMAYYQTKYEFYGKLYMDIYTKRIYRGEFNGSYRLPQNFKISAGYLYHEPLISYNTIFWVFTHTANQEIYANVDYLWRKNFNFYAGVSDVLYKDDHSLKIQAGLSHPNFGLSFVKYTGFAGESDGVYGYFNYELIWSKLSLTSGLNYSRYKLDSYATEDRVDSFTGLLGLVYRPIPRLTVDLQGQFLNNRIYKSDTRMMLGVTYWLFSKL